MNKAILVQNVNNLIDHLAISEQIQAHTNYSMIEKYSVYSFEQFTVEQLTALDDELYRLHGELRYNAKYDRVDTCETIKANAADEVVRSLIDNLTPVTHKNLVDNLRQSMTKTLTDIVKQSDKTVTAWKGSGGEKYINLDISVKHEGNYCATEYKALMLHKNGDLSLSTDSHCWKGTYMLIERMTLEQLASLSDILTGFKA